MNNKDFDKLIREQLRKLEADFDSQHWEMMEHRLDTDPAPEGEMRGQDSLDEVIGGKLGGLEVAFDASHWDLMDQKLDAELLSPEVEDIYLDGVAYDNLFDLSSPYNPAHWTLMSKRLDEAYSIRHKIYKYKIAEVAIMLLAIFTLLPYLPISKHLHKNDRPVATQQTLFNSTLPTIAANADAAKTDLQSSTSETALALQAPAATTSKATNITAATQRTEAESKTTVSTNSSNSIIPPVSREEQAGQNDAAQQQALAPLATLPQVEQQAETQAVEQQSLLIDPMDSRYSFMKEKDRPMPAGLLHLLPRKSKRIRIGMFGAFDMNYVMTPTNDDFSVPSQDQFFAGYGGGLSLGIGGKKWEFEIAAIYASTYYFPERVNVDINQGNFNSGYYGIGIKATQLELLKVPVILHRSLGRIGKLQFTANTGLAANVALFTNYETQYYKRGADPNQPILPSSPPEETDADAPNYDGLLQGGSLKNNVYLTANLGLRVERDLSARWSVFLQPNYQHRILANGFGPSKDKINSLSVYLGARVNLK